MKRRRWPFLAVVLAGLSISAAAQQPSKAPEGNVSPAAPADHSVLRIGGFNKPMGAVYDAVADRFLVANAAGGGLSTKHRGFISAVDPDGHVRVARWAAGLKAPKGMRAQEGKLYVADLDGVAIFDLKSAKLIRRISIKGAHDIIDVTISPEGVIYAVDNGKGYGDGAIYRVQMGEPPALVAKGTRFLNPMSVELVGGDLMIGPEIGGNLLRASLSGNILDVLPLPLERLQGTVVRPGDGVDGVYRIDDKTVAVVSRESGSLMVLDVSAPPPNPVKRVEEIARQQNITFSKALDDRRKQLLASGGFAARVRQIAGGKILPEADPASFAVHGVTEPGKFAFDSRRHRFLIPQIGTDEVVIASIPWPPRAIPRFDPALY